MRIMSGSVTADPLLARVLMKPARSPAPTNSMASVAGITVAQKRRRRRQMGATGSRWESTIVPTGGRL
jgi:hypothetical protein